MGFQQQENLPPRKNNSRLEVFKKRNGDTLLETKVAPANFWLKDDPFLLGRVPARYELLIFGSYIHDRLNPEKNRCFPKTWSFTRFCGKRISRKENPPNGWPHKIRVLLIETIFVCPRKNLVEIFGQLMIGW